MLAQARATLKSDLPPGSEHGSLQNTRYYLDLASFIATDRRFAHPSHLLRFYYTNLTPKLVLVRLPEEDQAYVIRRVAETFTACDDVAVWAPSSGPAADIAKNAGNGVDADDDAALRKQFPEICSVLLQVCPQSAYDCCYSLTTEQVFCNMKSGYGRPWPACHALVRGIARVRLQMILSGCMPS